MTDKNIMPMGLSMERWNEVEELLSRANKEQLKLIKEMVEAKLTFNPEEARIKAVEVMEDN